MALTKTDTTVTNIPDISKSIRNDMSIDGTRAYIDTSLTLKSDTSHTHPTYAPLNNPVFTGTPLAPAPGVSDNSTRLATTSYVRSYTGSTYLPLGGGALTDYLTLHADPTNNMHAATKRYVDNAILGGSVTSFTSSNIAINTSTNVASVSHTLGVVPSQFSLFIVCVSAEQGYSIGDRIDLKMPAGTQVYNLWASSTQIGIASVNNFSILFSSYFVPKTGSTSGGFTASNWRFVFTAIA